MKIVQPENSTCGGHSIQRVKERDQMPKDQFRKGTATAQVTGYKGMDLKYKEQMSLVTLVLNYQQQKTLIHEFNKRKTSSQQI